MSQLHSLYNKAECNSLCAGCSVLDKSKPVHSHMDYESLQENEVLFLADSFSFRFHNIYPFSDKEKTIIDEVFPGSNPAFSASIKCPSVKEGDMTPDNMVLCRKHLQATVDKVKPKLILPCGNLAMKMLIKKSGITSKRGKSFEFTTDNGHECTVVPIFHPYSIIKEPRHKLLFETDIKNAYEKYVLEKKSSETFSYKVVMDISDLESLADNLRDTEETLAMDIETTGLNFLTCKIQTIAISSRETNWVIPLDHKDSPFKKGEPDYPRVWTLLRQILENPKSRKVFHNAKFDLKFLLSYGIHTKNVWDTKIMHHLLDENMPKSLMDLVKLYFPTELESL